MFAVYYYYHCLWTERMVYSFCECYRPSPQLASYLWFAHRLQIFLTKGIQLGDHPISIFFIPFPTTHLFLASHLSQTQSVRTHRSSCYRSLTLDSLRPFAPIPIPILSQPHWFMSNLALSQLTPQRPLYDSIFSYFSLLSVLSQTRWRMDRHTVISSLMMGVNCMDQCLCCDRQPIWHGALSH